MKNEDFLNSLRIASPCPVGWEQMTGDERKRHCRLCDLHVYNISEMSHGEVQSVIAKSEGRVCARLFRRADGTVITRDCPVGSRALRRRVAKTAAAAFAAILSLASIVVGQKPKSEKGACVPQVTISRKVPETKQEGPGIVLQLFDINGASIAGAEVTLTETPSLPTGSDRMVVKTSNDEGRVEFAALPKGSYDLKITQPGFDSFQFTKVAVDGKELVEVKITMTVSQSVTVGILMFEPAVLDKPIGTTIITREMIDKLPFQN